MPLLDAVAAPAVATHHHAEWDFPDLAEMKGELRVVVCIPARNEVRTIGPIVSAVHSELTGPIPLVDEILVVDDGSTDGTAAEAARNGAVVVRGPRLGKGEAMREAFGCSDVVVFLDGDVENFGVHFVTGLLGALLCSPGREMAKGTYSRPLGGDPTGGGRVTEIAAKPILCLLFPELAGVTQPLAGETAIRSRALAGLELAGGYGVEIGMLIDVWRRYGIDAIAQVDLGERRHRNRPLSELGQQAQQVLGAALARADLA